MYRVVINDATKLEKLLTIAGSGWITMIGTADGVLMVHDSSEIFTALQLQSSRAKSDGNFIVRMQTSILKNICVGTALEITVMNDTVCLSAVNGEVRRQVKTPKHIAYTTTFADRLQIVSENEKYEIFNAGQLRKLCGVAKLFGSFIDVEGNVAGTISKSGLRIYQSDLKGLPEFSVSAKAANALFQCADEWFCKQNYLVALDKNFCVLVMQSRGNSDASYMLRSIKEQKAAMIANVHLGEAFALASKLSKSTVSFNFVNDTISVCDGDDTYLLSMRTTEKRIAEGFKDELSIPTQVLTSVVSKFGETQRVSIKQCVCTFESDEYCVVCGR